MNVNTTEPICPTCLRAINAVLGCEPNHAFDYGLEPDSIGYAVPDNCSDCGAHVGKRHHVPGCTVAVCRTCRDQATFCGCAQ